MNLESFQFFNRFVRLVSHLASIRIVLFGCYRSYARFPLQSDPFMNCLD